MDWLLTLYVVVTIAGQPAEATVAPHELVRASTKAVCDAYGAERARQLTPRIGRPVQHRCVLLPMPPEPAPSTPERQT